MASINISKLSPIVGWAQYGTLNTLIDTKIATAINFFTGFAALVAVIIIIVAGYMFITSAGDADKVDRAGKTMTGAIVGLVIVFIARILVEFVIKAVVK
ncbi:MAG: hypothetical protein UR73_C0015G0005 [candidate division WS6 bacterium GW2011_GWF1_35_23]|uniref:Uncharacterized protein n=1 Tax=candidate division WS6 bacterium GW2011_GWF1_35_23 TaxID=1619097 RepID=A0A0G0FDU1_9BACT|nr:MAG: hypothetical protein UR73_C0015G0005 [candidate division WS6 bacterium GW2011_GWF1_35_23]